MGGPNSGRIERQPERNAKILELWRSGETQTRIALRMGISRHVAAGVLHRARDKGMIVLLEVCGPWQQKTNWALPRPRKRTGRKHKGQETQQIVQGGRQALELVGSRDCRYPFGNPGQPGFSFCCKPRQGMGPYCPEHAARCRQKAGATQP